ncbi:MAG: type I restriction enzyme HsdR N-terminal domain-containing protein [Azonexus sp.]|jgi:hypothetical protein|nr:type I restriction enzyme HsdR N-terminal domain-containing protein [Azonexus sp.]
MQAFTQRVIKHGEHVRAVGTHCTTEETTKQALILPLLDILGFSPFDPTRVKAEYGADFPGAKANERVDYALFCQGVPVMFIEAKAYEEKLANHCPQLARYFNATPEVTIAAITNGREWRFFTDLNNKNVMDVDPFLTVSFDNLDESLLSRLYRFRHDEFKPEALRTLAEESIYLAAFKDVISSSLKTADADFVRYIAGRAGIQRQFNQRFIESITPLVRQAIEKSVSEMVVSGLAAGNTAPPVVEAAEAAPVLAVDDDQVDPANSKIITTRDERRILEITREILGHDLDIQPKDTESYYAALFEGKNNRWLLHYYGDKRVPTVNFPVELTEARRTEITRAGLELGAGDSVCLPSPEHLLRIPGILFDALAYVRNDENFRRGGGA